MSILVFVGPDRLLPASLTEERGSGPEPVRDAAAIEIALRLQDRLVAGPVIAVGLDGPGVDYHLRRALASGVDRAIRLCGPDEGVTTIPLARQLARLIEEEGAAVAVVRNRTSTLESCLLASAVGEDAGLVALTGVTAVESTGGDRVVVSRTVDGEVERLACSHPIVLGVERGPTLRYPTLPDRWRAERADIPAVPWSVASGATQPAPQTTVEAVVPPKPLRKPPADPTPGELRAMAKVMGVAGTQGGGGSVLEGDPTEIARRLATVLKGALGR